MIWKCERICGRKTVQILGGAAGIESRGDLSGIGPWMDLVASLLGGSIREFQFEVRSMRFSIAFRCFQLVADSSATVDFVLSKDPHHLLSGPSGHVVNSKSSAGSYVVLYMYSIWFYL